METRELVKICSMIDRVVWEKFKQIVLTKYGCLRWALAIELTKVLEAYIDSWEFEHMHAKTSKHVNAKISPRFIKLLEFLKDYEELQDVDIRNFIANNFGFDRRTINKYMGFALKFLELKLTTKYGRKIFRVKHEAIEKFLKELEWVEEDEDG